MLSILSCRRIVVLFAVIIYIIGCSGGISRERVEPELRPYHQEFLNFFNLKSSTVRLHFTHETIGDNVIGVCNYLTNTIQISYSFWRRAPFLERYALIFHEMIHCELFQHHRDEVMGDGCPASIMNSILPPEYCLNKHWGEYIDELRRNSKSHRRIF